MARWLGHLSPTFKRVIQPDADELSPWQRRTSSSGHGPPNWCSTHAPTSAARNSRQFNEPHPIQSGKAAVATRLRFEGRSLIPPWGQASTQTIRDGQRKTRRFIEIPSAAASTNALDSFNSSTCESESLTEPHARARLLALYSRPRKGREFGTTYAAWFSRPIVVSNSFALALRPGSFGSLRSSLTQARLLSVWRESLNVRVLTSQPRMVVLSEATSSARNFETARRSS